MARESSQRSSRHRRAGGQRQGDARQGSKHQQDFKLQKALADRGIGSRREMERWIAAGRITVNGSRATLGQRVTASDRIALDGRPLNRAKRQPLRILVANKRAGVIVSRKDPEGRPSVFDDLPPLRDGRWIAVGRLDLQTAGLIIFTNDGAFAHRLMHPSTGIDREYAVRLNGKLAESVLRRLQDGIAIDGRIERFSDVRYYDGEGDNHWYHVVLMEGRNREVRQLFGAVGVAVTRLKRVRYGPVVLPPWLPRGTWQEMGSRDLARLGKILGLPAPNRGRRRTSGANQRTMLIPYPQLAG